MTVGARATNLKLPAEVAVPPAVVTEILTVPGACGLVLARIRVLDVTRKDAAGVVPNLTDVAPMKLVPLMTINVPPVIDPLVGVKLVIVGVPATNLKLAVEVAVPPGVVTEILTVAAAWDLVTALILVALVTV